jgi:hypothetical protein
MYPSGSVLLELSVEIERSNPDAHRLLFPGPRRSFTGAGLARLMTCGFDAAGELITSIIIIRGRTSCR